MASALEMRFKMKLPKLECDVPARGGEVAVELVGDADATELKNSSTSYLSKIAKLMTEVAAVAKAKAKAKAKGVKRRVTAAKPVMNMMRRPG